MSPYKRLFAQSVYKGLICFIYILFFFNTLLYASNELDSNKIYEIDFEKQTITVFGIGGQPWEEENYISIEKEKIRAYYDALHHAYEAILNIPVMDGKNGKNILFVYPSLKEKIKNLLFSLTPSFFENQSKIIKCKLEIPFFGPNSLCSAFYLASLYPTSRLYHSSNTTSSQILPLVLLQDEHKNDSHATKNKENTDKISNVKRIIVDLRNTPYQPSLFPSFFSEKGQLIFQESIINSKLTKAKFSKPIIKFYKSIISATENFTEKEIWFINAKTAEMSNMNIVILDSSKEFFIDFVSFISQKPESQKDIAIVYGNEKYKFVPGILNKSLHTSQTEKQEKKQIELPKTKSSSTKDKRKR